MDISVVIPVYNRPKMLLRAVESVLNQTFENFELIVVDDGSSLDLSLVREKIISSGHTWLQQAHAGVSAARNRGVRKSKARFISFLDSDDEWLADKLRIQFQYHLDNPQFQISQCNERWIKNEKVISKKKIHKVPYGDAFLKSVKMCCISPSSVMLTRKLYDEHGGFDEKLVVCEDYDLWLKITSDNLVGRIEDELVVKYGGHDFQLSSSQVAIDRFRVFSLLRLLCDHPLTNPQKEIVRKELKNKINILIKGARKHGSAYLEMYLEICEEMRKNSLETIDDSFLLSIESLIAPDFVKNAAKI